MNKENKMETMPKITKEPILHVDMTPSKELPIRILEAYLANCDCKWSTTEANGCPLEIINLMNKHNDERAEIFRKAIQILNQHMKHKEA